MGLVDKILGSKKQYEFIGNVDGLHQIGGDIPSNFVVPSNGFLAGFQYLGYVNKADPHFSWLPFDLHLICPIFTDFDFIVLDYSSPLKPKILYPENSADLTSAYDELTQESRIIYHSVKFSLLEFEGITEDNEFEVVALAGKPHWEQTEDWPIHPITKRRMRFVCQLMSNGPVTAKEKNFTGVNSYNERIFNELNFWGDGSLKVFIEPKLKTVCYIIHNS